MPLVAFRCSEDAYLNTCSPYMFYSASFLRARFKQRCSSLFHRLSSLHPVPPPPSSRCQSSRSINPASSIQTSFIRPKTGHLFHFPAPLFAPSFAIFAHSPPPLRAPGVSSTPSPELEFPGSENPINSKAPGRTDGAAKNPYPKPPPVEPQ